MYTKNTDPNYYYFNPLHSNCGSFALNVVEWYDPMTDELGDACTELVYEMAERQAPLKDVYEVLTAQYALAVLEDFEDTLRILDSAHDLLDKDEELIAFRLGIDFTDEADVDFHFRVKRNGQWMEKCGTGEVRTCPFEETPWRQFPFQYEGPIVYFAHKIDFKF